MLYSKKYGYYTIFSKETEGKIMIRNILEYLEHTAARLPEKTAFSAGEDRISFAELETAAKKSGRIYCGSAGGISLLRC